MLPNGVFQGFRGIIFALQKIAHEKGSARLHEGSHAVHVVTVLAVSLSTKAIHQLIALYVVLWQRNAMVVEAFRPLRALSVSEMDAEISSVLPVGVHKIGPSKSCVSADNTSRIGWFSVRLVVIFAHELAIPDVVLVSAFEMVLLGVHKFALLTSWAREI